MAEAEHLHWAKITGDPRNPQIEFTCHGDRSAECHSYPDCDCESYMLGAEFDNQGHPFVPHDECWMQSWFRTESLDPPPDELADNDLLPGMSGPIKAWGNDEYLEWEFIGTPRTESGS